MHYKSVSKDFFSDKKATPLLKNNKKPTWRRMENRL